MQQPDSSDQQPTQPQGETSPAPKVEVKVEAPKVVAAPVSNSLQPNKNVEVPKYAQCLAGDATPIDEGVIRAVTPKKDSK